MPPNCATLVLCDSATDKLVNRFLIVLPLLIEHNNFPYLSKFPQRGLQKWRKAVEGGFRSANSFIKPMSAFQCLLRQVVTTNLSRRTASGTSDQVRRDGERKRREVSFVSSHFTPNYRVPEHAAPTVSSPSRCLPESKAQDQDSINVIPVTCLQISEERERTRGCTS